MGGDPDDERTHDLLLFLVEGREESRVESRVLDTSGLEESADQGGNLRPHRDDGRTEHTFSSLERNFEEVLLPGDREIEGDCVDVGTVVDLRRDNGDAIIVVDPLKLAEEVIAEDGDDFRRQARNADSRKGSGNVAQSGRRGGLLSIVVDPCLLALKHPKGYD